MCRCWKNFSLLSGRLPLLKLLELFACTLMLPATSIIITIHMPVRTSRILLVRFLSNQSANIFFGSFTLFSHYAHFYDQNHDDFLKLLRKLSCENLSLLYLTFIKLLEIFIKVLAAILRLEVLQVSLRSGSNFN